MRALIDASLRVGERAARATREGKPRDLPLRLALRFADRLVLQKLRQVMGGNVRFMVTGSAPTPIPLLEFFDAIGLPLYEAYGMSENVVPMALNRPAECRLGTVGKPLPYNETKLAEDGELLVRGAGVFAGYHKDDRADIFTADGYYRTGDFAKFDDDGFLRLGGRKSEIIKTSTGRRISPLGIEALLQEIAYVDRAVVVGAGRKALAAILIVKADYRLSFDGSLTQNSRAQRIVREQDLRADVTRTLHALPAHEHPIGYLLSSYTLSIEAGELTPNLKLKRKAIESRFESELDQLYRQAEAKPNEPAARVCN
jgi:long-chain acyl-CoA synthetase